MVYSLSQRGSWPLRIQFWCYDSLNFLLRFNAADTHLNIRSNHSHRGRLSTYRLRSQVSNRQPRRLPGIPKSTSACRNWRGSIYRHIHDLRVGACNENRPGRFLCHVFVRTASREFPALLAVYVFFYSNHSYLKTPMISGAQRRITLEIVAHVVVLQPRYVSWVVWNCPHTPAD